MRDSQAEELLQELVAIREELKRINRILFWIWDQSQDAHMEKLEKKHKRTEKGRVYKNENIRKSEYSGF